jgi:hypothetical protein
MIFSQYLWPSGAVEREEESLRTKVRNVAIRPQMNGSKSGIRLPHSKTLARRIERDSFGEVLECGSPMPLSLLSSAPTAQFPGLVPLYLGVAPLLTSPDYALESAFMPAFSRRV